MSNGASILATVAPSPLPDSAAIYRSYAPRVVRWVAQIGGPEIDAEDATQDVFLVAHRQRGRFRGEAQVATWLYGIARNVVRHHRRKQRRGCLAGSADEVAGHLESPAPTPIDQIELRHSCERLYSALGRLRERDRAIIVMFELEGLSGEQIADRTGCRLATFWVRLHRARGQLSRELRA